MIEKRTLKYKVVLERVGVQLKQVWFFKNFFPLNIFFSIWVLFHEHSRITGLQGKGEGIPLTPHYHFHPLHRHLDISRAITAESSPLLIASSRTRIGTFGFRAQVANHYHFANNVCIRIKITHWIPEEGFKQSWSVFNVFFRCTLKVH